VDLPVSATDRTAQLGYDYDSYAQPPEPRPRASRDGPTSFGSHVLALYHLHRTGGHAGAHLEPAATHGHDGTPGQFPSNLDSSEGTR
jgi:hypothetical protein